MTFTCEICKTDFELETYGDGACPTCGQVYNYDEGHSISLTAEQLEILAQHYANKRKVE